MDVKKNKLGLLIRCARLKKGLSIVELANLCNYSRSYISKVETEKIDVSDETVKMILGKMNVDFNITDLEVLDTELDSFYDIMMLDFDEKHEKFKLISKNEKTYISTPLAPKYYLYCFCYENITKNSVQALTYLKILQRVCNDLNNQNKQIYYDFCGIYYRNIGSYENALNFFQLALSQGIHERSYSCLCNHLGNFYALVNNPVKACEFYNLALHHYKIEGNINREIHIKISNANLLSRNYAFKDSINEYLKLLKFINGNNFDKYKSVVLNNLVWTYMLNNDYEKALERIDDLVNLGDDFEYLAYHKSLCLYYLGQLDAALTALNSVNEVSDRILLGKCKVLKILINGNEDEKLEKELLKQYKLIRSKSDPQTQMYYINELINFYTKNHKYKQLSKFQDIKIKLLENDSFF